jgi:hypothetical protein
MPKYDIQVIVRYEVEDMEFDSEAEAEAFGWEMVHQGTQHHYVVVDIITDEAQRGEEE